MNLTCEKCGTSNPGNVKFCKQCGNQLILNAATTAAFEQERPKKDFSRAPISAIRSSAAPPVGLRYGTLRSIAAICRIIGYALGGLGVLTGVLGAISRLSDSFLLAIGVLLGSLLGAAVVFVFWLIIAESISVILDIEENTRKTAVLLQQREV